MLSSYLCVAVVVVQYEAKFALNKIIFFFIIFCNFVSIALISPKYRNLKKQI